MEAQELAQAALPEDWVFPVRDPDDPRKVHPWFRDPNNHHRVAPGIELKRVALRQLKDFVQDTQRISERGNPRSRKFPRRRWRLAPSKSYLINSIVRTLLRQI